MREIWGEGEGCPLLQGLHALLNLAKLFFCSSCRRAVPSTAARSFLKALQGTSAW